MTPEQEAAAASAKAAADHLEKWTKDQAAQAAAWLKEFEAIGPDEVRFHLDNGGYPQDHPRRALALRWLKDHSASPLGSAP